MSRIIAHPKQKAKIKTKTRPWLEKFIAERNMTKEEADQWRALTEDMCLGIKKLCDDFKKEIMTGQKVKPDA